MSKRLFYKLLIAGVFKLVTISTSGQNTFSYKAALGKADTEGFYKIVLPSKVIGRTQPGLVDLRIRDEKGEQVPYIVKTDQPVFNENRFIKFPIVSNRKEADKQTHVIIKNPSIGEVSRLLLVVRNTEARRFVTLSGSDDNERWFVVKENIFLESYFSDNGTFIQTLTFPPSKYRYFKITIQGENVLPVDIVKAGIYKESFTEGKYVELPKPEIEQTDSSNKHSYLRIRFNETYAIDKLELQVAGPKFYRRTGEFFSQQEPVPFHTYVLSSTSSASLPVQFRTREITVVINNEDNPPVKVSEVKAFQLRQYLLAYLETGKNYTVYFGDSTASAPKYDLAFFKDGIGSNPGELTIGAIEELPKAAKKETKKESLFGKLVLWTVLIVVLVVLITFTFRLSKEVNQRSSK